jgi:hypothetical protein
LRLQMFAFFVDSANFGAELQDLVPLFQLSKT